MRGVGWAGAARGGGEAARDGGVDGRCRHALAVKALGAARVPRAGPSGAGTCRQARAGGCSTGRARMLDCRQLVKAGLTGQSRA